MTPDERRRLELGLVSEEDQMFASLHKEVCELMKDRGPEQRKRFADLMVEDAEEFLRTSTKRELALVQDLAYATYTRIILAASKDLS